MNRNAGLSFFSSQSITIGILALMSTQAFAGSWFFTPKNSGNDLAEQQVKGVLKNNPEIVYNALVEYQKKQSLEKKEVVQKYLMSNARKIFYSANDGVIGNPQGKTSLVILSDYRCGYCTKARAVIDEVIKENKDLRVVVKQLPILGPESKYAAKAAILAQQKNQFLSFDSKLLATESPITQEKINAALTQSGIKVKEISNNAESLDKAIYENYSHAQNLAVQGTPVLIVANSNLTKVEFVENNMDKNDILKNLDKISK